MRDNLKTAGIVPINLYKANPVIVCGSDFVMSSNDDEAIIKAGLSIASETMSQGDTIQILARQPIIDDAVYCAWRSPPLPESRIPNGCRSWIRTL